MEEGLWDSAFGFMGNNPLAISLRNNVFGAASYVGNHMLEAMPGQTMYDAYDGLIFLSPLENLHTTALVDFIFTPEFRAELERRYKLLYTEVQLKKMMTEAGVSNLTELIDNECQAEEVKRIPQIQTLDPIDAWKK